MEERGLGIGRSLAYGALAGLLVVAALAAYVWYRMSAEPASAGAADVIVVLVLPDEEGVVLPRVIDRYTDGEITPVDPLSEARVPGTSYNVLREAYPFSGARGLAAALVGESEGPPPSYVVLDADMFEQLAGDDAIEIEIPEHMDVFDGKRLYTFREGDQRIDPDEIAALFNGAEYLDAEPRADLRERVGEVLRTLLARQGIGEAETDLRAEEIEAWLEALGE